jgi:hypothetical protein
MEGPGILGQDQHTAEVPGITGNSRLGTHERVSDPYDQKKTGNFIDSHLQLLFQDVGYQIFATCSTFYVPLLVILVLYWKIFQTARKRIRRRRVQRAHVEPTEKQPKLRFLSKKRY